MRKNQMLACPFCGSRKVEIRHDESGINVAVECQHCFARGPAKFAEPEPRCDTLATEAWNGRRKADDPNWVHPADCGYAVTGKISNCDCDTWD